MNKDFTLIGSKKKLIGTEERILKAKQDWEHTVDSIPDAIAIIDTDYRIIRLNKSMLDKIGASHYDEVIGSKCYVCAHATEKPPEFCPHSKLLEDMKEHQVEIFNEQFGGHCEITVTPYFDDEGKHLGAIHIVREINGRKKAEREKERLISKKIQFDKLRSVGQLASGIAHEINTPAQFIGANIEFLKDSFEELTELIKQMQHKNSSERDQESSQSRAFQEDWKYLSDEIPAAIEQTKEGIGRISSIVRAMKEFSHPGSKSKSPVDFNHLIETTVTIARNEWKYVADVNLQLAPDLTMVYCSANEISQVILNLLLNATHAIEEKIGKNPVDQKGSITITTRKTTEGTEFKIRDTGAGIKKEAESKIYEPFFTTKEPGKGTGQGLSITYDIVINKHSGRLDFTSVKEEGTEFTLWLPAKTE